ncbi:hypothetical protein [Shewanella sp. MEBiC00475]|uniref:hypothetical protein n=1 Tax=Shewanella sp. MEBiC00475 TaxID=2575361 RepID=UPI0010BF9CFA|nr:hypothetical protein [Shewanella sp. MEBiC00475]
MTAIKHSPTKTTLQKIKKESKSLDPSLGSLQARQNIVAQSFGYNSYHEFFEKYKKNIHVVSDNPFDGMGCFSGELILDATEQQNKKHNMTVVNVEEYEITHRFELKNNLSSNKCIKIFCEEIEPHIQDYASLIFKAVDKENEKNSYNEFLDLVPNFNLRSVDIVIGIDFPKGLSPQEEFKFAEKWFFDEGKGGRICLSNFPNDGLVPVSAVSKFLSIIRAVAEQSFQQKCYVFFSTMHQDFKWNEAQGKKPLH